MEFKIPRMLRFANWHSQIGKIQESAEICIRIQFKWDTIEVVAFITNLTTLAAASIKPHICVGY